MDWIRFDEELPKDSKLILLLGVGVDGRDKIRMGELKEWSKGDLLYVLGHSQAQAFSLDGTHSLSYSPNPYVRWKYIDIDCMSCAIGWEDDEEI